MLGPESNEQTSAAVVLTLLFGLGRYLVGYGCPIDVDGVVERVRFRRAASSSVSSSTSQPGLIRKYDTIDEEGEIFKGFTTTRLYMPVPGGHWLYPALKLHRLHSYLRSPPASPSSLLIPSI